MFPAVLPFLWFLLMPPISALLSSVVLNSIAKHRGPLPVQTIGGLAPRERRLGEPIERERVRIRGVGVITPGLIGIALGLTVYTAILIFAAVDGAMAGLGGEELMIIGIFLAVVTGISFVCGVVAAFVFNGACRIFGGLTVEVE